jgi:hypothetical protein
LAARIRDLRENGERIEVVGERHGCAVYKLAVAPVRAMPISVRLEPERPAADSTPQLFELPPRNAILGEEAA